MQKALNERIGVKMEGMTEEEKTKWVLNYCRAMTQEIAELTDSVPWKWWAKYQKFDEQNARVEVVDLFHFLISIAQVLGMSADDVFNAPYWQNQGSPEVILPGWVVGTAGARSINYRGACSPTPNTEWPTCMATFWQRLPPTAGLASSFIRSAKPIFVLR